VRFARIAPALGLILLLSSCGPVESQNSLFAPKDVIFDSKLIGTWVEESDSEVVTFERSNGQTYKIVYREKADREPITLEAQLGRISGLRFLDISGPPGQDSAASAQGRGAHMFFRVWRKGNSLRLAGLDSDWVAQMLTSGKATLDYHRVDKEIVLTAPTADLQRFIVKYANDKEAFPDPMTFHRQP
jgi:hypothetical protein